MKIIVQYCLFLISCTLYGQTISFDVVVKSANCNNSNNGKAEITITDEINPPYTYLWSSGSEERIVSGLAPGNYSVKITDSTGNDTTVTVTISELPCEIGPSVVFTPNDDSFNDTWYINNIGYYPDNLIQVFNRWGQKVYESKGIYEPWDGKDLLSIPLPDNSYYYIIFNNKDDKEPSVKGTVSILR